MTREELLPRREVKHFCPPGEPARKRWGLSVGLNDRQRPIGQSAGCIQLRKLLTAHTIGAGMGGQVGERDMRKCPVPMVAASRQRPEFGFLAVVTGLLK